jgi:hypothetical protein
MLYFESMANRTIAEQIAVLEARRDKLEAALDAVTTGTSSVAVDGMSTSYSSPDNIQKELTRCEKSLQRLYRGGRGFQIDLSSTGLDDASKLINTTYTQVNV